MGIWICSRQKLTSPKWNRFKGIRLRWKDKIRLNNVIWRCWHMQCKRKKNHLAPSVSQYILKINRGTLRHIFWYDLKCNLSLRESIFALLGKCGVTQLPDKLQVCCYLLRIVAFANWILIYLRRYRSKHSILNEIILLVSESVSMFKYRTFPLKHPIQE